MTKDQMAVAYFNETDRYNRRVKHLEKLIKCQDSEIQMLKKKYEPRIYYLSALVDSQKKEINDLRAKLTRLDKEPDFVDNKTETKITIFDL